MRAAFLAQDQFGPNSAKTATCLLRYRDRYEPVAVIDRTKANRFADEFVGPIGKGVPIVATMDDALEYKPEALVIGIAPPGGGLPEAWRPDLRRALEAGVEVHSGLHVFLQDDLELAALADAHGARLWDVRKPTRPNRIATGEGHHARALVVHTVGTDCNSGKMTVSVELAREAKRRGWNAAFAATGQTGIMVGCEAGAPIDRVISDFVAGAAEELVLQCDELGHDVIFVEGQGSLTHPAYSGVTLGLLHGCAPDLLVLCHDAARVHHNGYPNVPLLPLPRMIELLEAVTAPLRPAKVCAVAVATHRLDAAAARQAIAEAEAATGLPASDPVRDGPGKLLDAVLAAGRSTPKEGARRLASTSTTSS